ncbi:calsequestrin-1 isoform X7 [Zonotrichia albicollis]|uniref:calsequestrin-1 isoform X7 n=1 Tax=Zonotrichia albicollis TaxID=44394 RepID=UPI003D80FB9A
MSPLWLLALLALTPGVPGGPEVCPGVCPSVCPGCPGVHPAVSPAVCPGCPGVCPGPALPLPVPDGLSRLRPVPPGTLPELLRRFPVLALLRSPGGSGHRAQELRALELVAQALEPRGVGFGIVDTDTEPELAREWGLAGRWRLALLRGHSVTEYPGELAVPALLRFLSQVLPQQLRDFGDIEEEPEGTGDCWGQRRFPPSPLSLPVLHHHPALPPLPPLPRHIQPPGPLCGNSELRARPGAGRTPCSGPPSWPSPWGMILMGSSSWRPSGRWPRTGGTSPTSASSGSTPEISRGSSLFGRTPSTSTCPGHSWEWSMAPT